MPEIRLDDIVGDVIVSLISSALIGVGIWAFRGKILAGLTSLYMSTSEAITIPVALCIEILHNLARLTRSISSSRFSAVFGFQVSLSQGTSGEECVGPPTSPTAPKLRISENDVLNTFSATHSDLVAECKKRYSDFKQNSRFHRLLKSAKEDPNCAIARRLNPDSIKSSIHMFYNLDAVLEKLDDEYTKRK